MKVPEEAVGILFSCKNFFGESFAAFQLRGGFVRSENSQAA